METGPTEITPKAARRRSPFTQLLRVPTMNREDSLPNPIAPPKATEESVSASHSLLEGDLSESDLTVASWIEDLAFLTPQLQDKYKKLFEEEEIISIHQVKKLTEKHLHWMGVKAGTLVTMVESIQRLNSGLFSYKAPQSLSVASDTPETQEGGLYSPVGPPDLRNTAPVIRTGEGGTSPPIPTSKSQGVDTPLQLHQAGGHVRVVTRCKPGFVKKDTDSVEAAFYFQFRDSKKIPDQFKTFFPKLDSIIESSTVLGRKISVVMEDLTFAYSRPCIMDIKMGTKTYAEDTNMFKKKIRQLKDDGTTSSRYGLRITGFRTFNMASNQFFEFGKEAAERISNIESMEQKIKDFYFNGNVVRKDVVLYFIERLTLLLSWMNTQNYYRFYSSSLLFVYEGQTEQLFKADVRMIDFAHVHEIRDGGIDEGYVKGLKKLIEILTKLSH